MAGQIKIDTEQVETIAGVIEGLNGELKQKLIDTQTTIEGLQSSWEGQASEETVKAYRDFASKYFESYYDVIDQYVKFLRQNVATGYTQTENANYSLADKFR